jgi:hypothetical protein
MTTLGEFPIMYRLVLTAFGAMVFAGGAQAATCPAFAPPVIKFVPLPSDVERDTSKTAKELGAAGASAKPQPASYDRQLSGQASRSVSIQKQPDGTVCAAIQEVDFKLGFQRKIYVAQEFAADKCVADTVADFETPLVKSDEDVLASFGASIPQTYGADINAIGTSTGKSSEDAQKAVVDKVSSIWKDKIFPAFSQHLQDAAAKVDLTKWQKAPCNGATDKAFAAIDVKPSDLNKFAGQQQQQQQQRTGGYGGSAGRY